MPYPPEDRAEAARALTDALVQLDNVLTRLQAAAAWFLDSYGDPADAETVRMLRIPDAGPVRPGRPAVPPATSRHSTDDLAAGIAAIDMALGVGGLIVPSSVTRDETGSEL